MSRILLALLLLMPLKELMAQEESQLRPGDWVRIWRPWPFDYWAEGAVIAQEGDTLIVNDTAYQTNIVISLKSVERLEVRRGQGIMGRHWKPIPVVKTAAVAKSPSKVRVNIGIAAIGIGGGIGLTYQADRHMMSIRATRVYERFVWDWEKAWEKNGDIDSPGEQSWDVGVLYGRTTKLEYVSVVFSGGLGLTGGIRRGDYLAHIPRRGNVYEKRSIRAFGVPIELQVIREVSENAGLGLYGYGNLNREASFGGLLLFLQAR